MGWKMSKVILSLGLLGLFITSPVLSAESEDYCCVVYFTGVGCPHCANTDLLVLEELFKKRDNFIVIEYEIYHQRENGSLLMEYNNNYASGLGIPLIIFNKDKHFKGDKLILGNISETIDRLNSNPCPLKDGSSATFDELHLTTLPGKPKIWKGEKILVRIGSEGDGDNALLKDLLTTEDFLSILQKIKFRFRPIEPLPVMLSGKSIRFDNAVEMDGWIFQWGRKKTKTSLQTSFLNVSLPEEDVEQQIKLQPQKIAQKQKHLGFHKIFLLALADTVNPCALAVFILFLIGIMSYNPGKEKRVLFAGAAFVSAVYICYFIYGLIIVKFWQMVQTLSAIRLAIYKILGVVAIALGLLHFKDFFYYKPGGFATEMPMGWRGKVKKMMLGITSTRGAFLMGAFVTIFLMPCTMGPYLIAGGILSPLELIKTIPWLLIYNLVFVLPLYGIVLVVYFGFKKVEDISGWKERNIRRLHLIVGFIMLFIGLGIILRWI